MINQSLAFPWETFIIFIPLIAGIFSFLFSKHSRNITIISSILVLISVLCLNANVSLNGVILHKIGGWGAPLGIDHYTDGLSLVMLSMTALLALGISIYASGYFPQKKENSFWPLFNFLIGALNVLFLSMDIFNFYVCLELIGLCAVAMTALGNTPNALNGAMKYLLATLFGSLLYLFGVGLLYHTYSTVDMSILANLIQKDPSAIIAALFITFGLMLKTALFPFHFWLPNAHSSAPAPVSAILSALVVKASLYILIRVWIDIFNTLDISIMVNIFGTLGVFAVLWGSILALKQERLKLLIAYSTVAQIGYLFIAFSLTLQNETSAWKAVIILAISHAMAKAAMFMVAGNIIHFGNHDKIREIDRVAQRLPITITAFAIAGISIVGLPPTGGFVGKWYLLEAAINQNMWIVIITLLIGTFLSALYIFRVIGHAFTPGPVMHEANSFAVRMQWSALILAIVALLIGLFPMYLFSVLDIGLPFSSLELVK